MRNASWLTTLLMAGMCGSAAAASGVWSTNGPEGGDAAFVVADPASAGTLIAATRGGIFRSVDAGTTWQRFETGVAYAFPYALESASNVSSAFVAPNSNSLFRSQSGGDWMPTGLSLGSGAFLNGISLRPGSDQFIAVSSSLGLHLSTNGGTSFATLSATGLPFPSTVARIEFASPTRMYAAFPEVPAGATAQVYRSDDAGANWAPTADLPAASDAYLGYLSGDLEAAPSDPQRVYLSTLNSLFVSTNGGGSWSECGAGVNAAGGQVVVEASNPDRLWVTGESGVYSSINGCAGWTVHSSGMSSDGTRIDTSAAIALAPGFPLDPRLWVGTSFGGVYRSPNAGVNFVATNAGLVSTNIRAVAMHPVDANQILLGFGDAFGPSPAIYRSTDGGLTWPRSNAGMRASQLRGITIDPTTAATPASTHVYAVGSSRVLGVPASPATLDGGIYKSVNSGVSWSTIDNGLPATFSGGTRFIGTVRSAVLDPRSCAAPPITGPCISGPLQTVYVSASGRSNPTTGVYSAARIYKSTDAGANWASSESGLPAGAAGLGACHFSQIAVPLVINPTTTSTLYVGLSLALSTDPSCATPTPSVANGAFKSTDSGATWVHSSVGLPTLGGPGSSQWSVLALALDPNAPNTLYAGAYEPTPAGSFNGRVFKTINGGANWFDISVGIAGQDVRALLVDPSNSSIVYAASGGSTVNPGGVYKSTDAGLTWNSFSIGLPSDAATALALDPNNVDRLLAGTVGGLWELTQVPDVDSDGASTPTENAAPNSGDADSSGTPDSQESNVASFFGAPGSIIRKADKLSPVPAVTLKVAPLLGRCTRINNAHALPGDSLPADIGRGVAPSAFASGVLRFELPDCEVARVTVTVHGADFADVDWSWRNFGPLIPGDASSMAWYAFAGARKVAPGTWELTIDSRIRGNYRDDSNNILFVGAPAFVDIQIFGSTFE